MNLTILCLATILAITVICCVKLFVSCKHNFVKTDVHPHWSSASDKYPSQIRFILQCKHCSCLRSKKL